MTFRIRRLRLLAITTSGPFGTEIEFGPGLNVVWADNTKGKSTCMQGMLYALGLERMLSPRREVPLPYALTSYVETDNKTQYPVISSYVSLEIENGAKEIITCHRSIKSPVDGRLISVDFGPTLTDRSAQVRRRDFFVLDPGAASREDGFHFFLQDFLGWTLPVVKRYEAADTKLYLETVFPLFWVEQKAGWSSIPAAIPTYLRIRDVHKRAVEFIMDLEVHKLELRRLNLEERIASNARDWRKCVDEFSSLARICNARTEAVPQQPTIVLEEIERGHVVIADTSGWMPLENFMKSLRSHIAGATAAGVEYVGEIAAELEKKLARLNDEVESVNADRIRLYNAKQLKLADVSALRRRIKYLEEDLQKNLDVQKLQRYSGVSAEWTPHHCPTCEQPLSDTLLPQGFHSSVMPIEDNIEYIRAQTRMFHDILNRSERELNDIDQTVSHRDGVLYNLYRQIRSLRADLIASSASPSISTIEDRVRSENQLFELESLQSQFEDVIIRLKSLSGDYTALLRELALLPADKMSPKDVDKFKKLTALIREQARDYGFSTFDPAELTISEDSYRPQKEGFEIGFETSASDAIRLKWAYQLGLLELGAVSETNHPGMLLFDEPRQQSSAKVSFEHLISRAASSKQRDQQVIFSTSEELENVINATKGLDCKTTIFEGYIIQPIYS